jgi:hypothetical protein
MSWVAGKFHLDFRVFKTVRELLKLANGIGSSADGVLKFRVPLKYSILSFLFLGMVELLYAQTSPSSADTTSPKNIERLDTVLVKSKGWKFQKKGLYDETNSTELPNINGFYALKILDEDLGKDVWISLEPKCVKLEKISDKSANNGSYSFHLNWDKISGGCKWLGMGMGWDNWQPKDLSTVLDTAFLELHFKSLSDTMTNLPLALALEDYSGAQCWLGFDSRWLIEPIVTSKWTTVRIPLKLFPFEDFETDPTSIKQFIIQLEADGDILIDNFRISL